MQCWCFDLLSGTGLKLSWGSHQQLLKPARLFLELSRPFGCAKKPRTDTCVSPTVQHCHLPPWRFGLASLAQHVTSDSMHRYDAWSYFGPHVMSNSASLSPLFLLQLDVVVLFCFFFCLCLGSRVCRDLGLDLQEETSSLLLPTVAGPLNTRRNFWVVLEYLAE